MCSHQERFPVGVNDYSFRCDEFLRAWVKKMCSCSCVLHAPFLCPVAPINGAQFLSAYALSNYRSLIPSVEELVFQYHLQPEVAFEIVRPALKLKEDEDSLLLGNVSPRQCMVIFAHFMCLFCVGKGGSDFVLLLFLSLFLCSWIV